ncbi:hypothetical protein C8Q78DRAFT_1013305 [Trametes maxima]|nr:hypothetical protein C8Q78DRAFT_1058781 [Trametes maxima]KAI0674169.1 hypothetical protein C8Q78DRAFT_1013305 [Trametes maxima]
MSFRIPLVDCSKSQTRIFRTPTTVLPLATVFPAYPRLQLESASLPLRARRKSARQKEMGVHVIQPPPYY